jgi:hypothetical protein
MDRTALRRRFTTTHRQADPLPALPEQTYVFMVRPCVAVRARHNGIGRHDMGDVALASATWEPTPLKEEDKGETGGVAVGVAWSRHGLIANSADIATMYACEQGNDSLLSGRNRRHQEVLASPQA